MWEPAISGMGNAHNCAPKLQVYLPIFSLTPKASGSTRLQSCEDIIHECGIAIKQEKALDGDNLVLRLKKLRHQNTGQGFL